MSHITFFGEREPHKTQIFPPVSCVSFPLMASLTSAGESKDEPSLLNAGTYAPAPGTVRGAPSNLAVSPDGTLLAYAQGKNIVVRSVEDPASTYVFQGHKSNTTVARFSPDGKWVASGDDSGWVRVWAWDNPAMRSRTRTK